MNRFLLVSTLGAVFLVLLSGSAQTPSRDENWTRCQDNNPDLSIGACTALIESSAESPANRATAFHNRGDRYLRKGEGDKAIADYDAAIRLKPDDAVAFNNRGDAYLDRGEYDKAAADFDAAIRLNPDYVGAFNRRGYSNLFAGRFAVAASDFQKSMGLGATGPYSVLWLHLARARSAQDDAQELSRNAASLDLKVWPGPVVAFFLGQMNAEQVKAAANSDAKTQHERNCVASFFLGEKVLLDGKAGEAERLFLQSRETCPPGFIQYQGAQSELKRMGR
jgi:lipoprotein NlpI